MDMGSFNKVRCIEVFWIVITIDAPLAVTLQTGEKGCIKRCNSELTWKCKKYWLQEQKKKILVLEKAGHSGGGFFPFTDVSINQGCFFSFFKRNRKAGLFYISNSSEIIMNMDNHLSTSEVI